MKVKCVFVLISVVFVLISGGVKEPGNMEGALLAKHRAILLGGVYRPSKAQERKSEVSSVGV